MSTAYFNEPLPLKTPYPQRGDKGPIETTSIAITLLLVLIGLSLPGGKAPFPGPIWMPLALMVVCFGLAGLIFWLGQKIAPWEARVAWSKAFRRNNPDLDYEAIARVICHMRENTAYLDNNFKEVATTIAVNLRREIPWRQVEGVHSTFSWEVMHAYEYFSTGQGQLVESICPKH